MMNEKNLKFSYILIGFIFFTYVLIRAINVGATYDEAWTIEICSLSFIRILFLTVTANNHILNSLLIKLLFFTGNESLFIARLPSLLSFIPYLYFSYKITSKNLSPIVGLGCFTLLICNPFLLEFFSLARGYGPALALMLGSLYFASESIKRFSLSTFSKSLGLGALSVWAVFSMAYYWAALVFILNLIVFLKEDSTTLKRALKQSTLIWGTMAFFISFPLFRLVIHNQLYYGGTSDFYHDTLISLARHTLSLGYAQTLSSTVRIALNSFIALLITCISASYLNRKWLYSAKDLFVAITGLIILSIISAHYLAGVKYPIDRVALFLSPLLTFCLFFSLNELKRYLKMSILLPTLAAFLFNFVSKANIYKTTLWDFDAYTFEILHQINNKGEAEGKIIKFQAEPLFERTVRFYLDKNNHPFIEKTNGSKENYINPLADYLLFSSDTIPDWAQEIRENAGLDIQELYKNDIFIEYPEEHVVVFDLNKR